LDCFRKFLGEIALQFPALLRQLTFIVLYWEGIGSVFFFCRLWTGPVRAFGALAFLGMHVGFGLCLSLGIFSPVCCCGCVALLPPCFWDNVVFKFLSTPTRRKFKLMYSKNTPGETIANIATCFALLPGTDVSSLESEVYSNSVDLPRQSQEEPSVKFTDETPHNKKNDEIIITADILTTNPPQLPLQSRQQYTSSKNNNNWVVAEDEQGKRHTGFSAFLAVCEVSPILFPINYLFKIAVIKRVGATIFVGISAAVQYYCQNCHPSSSLLTTLTTNYGVISSPTSRAQSKGNKLKVKKLLLSGTAFLLALYIISWNTGNLGYLPTPRPLLWVGWTLRLDQMWSMFSPRPPSVYWWYTVEGTLDDGSQMELWRNEGMFNWKGNPAPYNRNKPSPFAATIGNHRWFKLYESMNAGPHEEVIRLNLGRYICREYNARHPENRVYQFNIIYRNEQQHLDGTRTQLGDVTFWSHICYDK